MMLERERGMRESDKDAILVAAEMLKEYCSNKKKCWISYGQNMKKCPFLDTDNGNRCMLSRIPSKYDTDKIAEAVDKI